MKPLEHEPMGGCFDYTIGKAKYVKGNFQNMIICNHTFSFRSVINKLYMIWFTTMCFKLMKLNSGWLMKQDSLLLIKLIPLGEMFLRETED